MTWQRAQRAVYLILTIVLVFTLGSTGTLSTQAAPPVPPDSQPYGTRGQAAIDALGPTLEDVASRYDMTASELQDQLLTDATLWVDPAGNLMFLDTALPRVPDLDRSGIRGPYPNEQTFLLHSLPGASKVVYLDFDGHVTSGTLWNQNFNNGQDIISAPFDLDGSPSTWSQTELDRIQYMWQRVAEDYRFYNVDVTTQDPGVEALRKSASNDANYGVRMVASPSNWYNTNAGGVAYIGSFNWNTDTPCFAFTQQLANGEKYIAEAASHEVGHTVGLSHDGTTAGVTYYEGHGSWAPIMGVGYYRPIVQWSKGEYANANNTQDDLVVMQGYGIAYRTDDYGNTLATATELVGPTVSAAGIIEQRTDVDLFRFDSGAGTITLNVNPGPREPNLDIQAELLDANGNVLVTSNPTGLAASISTAVAGGTYYLRIDGVGTGDPSTGYSDYSSLGEFNLSGTIVSVGGQPPVAAASATPTSGTVPLAVAFSSAGSSDPDGTIVSYSWNFDDGGTSNEANPAHTYSTVGVFNASLTVIDNNGLSDVASVTITVNDVPNLPPVAAVSATPTSGNAPLAVAFSGAGSSDPDGTISSYAWNFGDGTTGSGVSVNHTYNSTGTFNAVLTVTDNDGATDTDTVVITVSQDPNNVVYIQSITMSVVTSGSNRSARAVVKIVNGAGSPVQGVAVSGRFSGLVTGNVSGTTNSSGEVTFTSKSTRKRGTVTLTVTGVTPPAPYTYDPSRNVVTSASTVL
jgi:PKD repeat protein